MNDERREALIADVKRYLGGKRSSGMSVAHHLFLEGDVAERPVGEEPSSAAQAAGRETGCAGTEPPRTEPSSVAPPTRSETEEGDGPGHDGAVKPAAAFGLEARGMPVDGENSIRRRQKTKSAHQESLFGGDESRETFDLGGHDLPALDAIVSSCTRCPLHEGRTKAVFGSGPPTAQLVFVGEAPGRDEDLQGVPFVGRAGKLLTKILASVGLSRDEVYITNILKCRPPGNRDPKEDEVTACEPYLRRQIELLDPILICALGRVAGQNLLGRNASLSVLRQNIHYYNDTKVLVTYHPAALLRNPRLKKSAWEDIQAIRKLYDEALGGE